MILAQRFIKLDPRSVKSELAWYTIHVGFGGPLVHLIRGMWVRFGEYRPDLDREALDNCGLGSVGPNLGRNNPS